MQKNQEKSIQNYRFQKSKQWNKNIWSCNYKVYKIGELRFERLTKLLKLVGKKDGRVKISKLLSTRTNMSW